MKDKKYKISLKDIYNLVVENKIITICILFTFITVFESFIIVLGGFPPKVGLGPYVHMLGRFVLNSIVVVSIYLFEILKKHIKRRSIIYLFTYLITLGLILAYVWMNGFFIELAATAYADVIRSYTFMYILLGVVYFIGRKAKFKNHN